MTNMFSTDLPALVDVMSEFDIPDGSSLNEIERADLVDTCTGLIVEFIENDPLVFGKPDYVATIKQSVIDLLLLPIKDGGEAIAEEEIELVFQMSLYSVFTSLIPRRSYRRTFIRRQPDVAKITAKLESIRSRPQAEQCTDQWYVDRWNRLSGSNAWKAFSTQSQLNSLIVEKCRPLCLAKYKSVNTESPLHHGKRFEPVSTMYYEYEYKTKVAEFGCVPHSQHSFLGASPDGIVVNPENPRYGRMLEIKNVTTRKINGIPKEDYWIQMQIQMEVCDLNECDFLETEIYTYESFDDFTHDGTFQKSSNGRYKGVIMYFIVDKQPYYEYAPFQCSEEECDGWQEEMMQKHKDHAWNCNIYYRIDKISCVLVLRNKLWAAKAIERLRDVWATIEKERVDGYAHREPRTRTTKPSVRQIQNVIKLDDMGQPSEFDNQQGGPAACLFALDGDTLQTIETIEAPECQTESAIATTTTTTIHNNDSSAQTPHNSTKRQRQSDEHTFITVETETA